MEIGKSVASDAPYVYIMGCDGATTRIYYGHLEACKTEAEAREAAELLKQFFEAKAAGKVARLVVENHICPDCPSKHKCSVEGECVHAQRPKNTVIDQMNDDERDHHAESVNKQFDNFEAGLIADRIWGNRANDMTLEQYEVFTIAHNAALIYAHNMHNTDERRAVQSAAKILKHAQESE